MQAMATMLELKSAEVFKNTIAISTFSMSAYTDDENKESYHWVS